MKNALYWLWLQKSLGVKANIRELVRYFGSAREIYNAGEFEWRTSELFGNATFELRPQKIDSMKNTPLSFGESIIKDCQSRNVDIITPDDENYPILLKQTIDYPAVLFVRGDISCVNEEITIGVIGTRKMTEYGKQAAEKIATGLARESTVIVSGGALGVDSVAHRCAINNGSKTILVMGCGHDAKYLAENEELRRNVERNGATITEYPPLTTAAPYTFPIRNRIISGISRGIVVIEASEKSGTLNTAKHAQKQNRDIFAVPGDIASAAYTGSNKLIVSGAKAVFSAADILGHYKYEFSAINEINMVGSENPFELIDKFAYGETEEKKKTKKKSAKTQNKLSSDDKKEKEIKKILKFDTESVSNNAKLVYNLMLSGLISLDDITRKSELPVRKVLTALTELEMAGAVEQQSGNQYHLVKC
ncbi:MAG: DNA-processing protein DprA [Faecalibacterium sp.]|nr:DNA-processing protein DprA [Ruminococcus sp.]MCM1391587.1 DNA-processing protein DprA [Ruminococcus sp.]MCM1486677.1 DNA-processing protein DprA [Faecalibacterium sp.]